MASGVRGRAGALKSPQRRRAPRRRRAKKKRLGCTPTEHLATFLGPARLIAEVKSAIADFAVDLFTTFGFKLSTVTQYLSRAAKDLVEPMGFGIVWTAKTNRKLKEVIDIVKKTQLAWVRRAAPIDRAFLLDAIRFVRSGRGGARRGVHLRCLITQWCFLGRVSEVVASGRAAGGTALLRKDVVTLDPANDGRLRPTYRRFGASAAALRFPGSKTDQAMAGQTRATGRTASVICAVACIEEQLAQPGQPDEPLFPGTTSLSLGNFVKEVAAFSGRDPSAYSTHSARRGGATAFYRACGSETMLKYFGRWAPNSTEHLVYMQPSMEALVEAGARMGLDQATSLGW